MNNIAVKRKKISLLVLRPLKLYICLVIVFFCSISYGQRLEINVSVRSSDKINLPGATVALYEGKTPRIIGVGATDTNGFTAIVAKDSVIIPSFLITRSIGYISDTIVIYPNVTYSDTLQILLKESAISLQSITVKDSRRGITVRGDTTTFDVSRFARDSIESLDNIISRLPGIDKDDKGYTYLGQRIARYSLDDDDFASNQSTSLLAALQAREIDDIEVSPIRRHQRKTGEFELNLKLENGKKNNLFGRTNLDVGISNSRTLGLRHNGFALYSGTQKWFLNSRHNSIGNLQLEPLDYLNLIGYSFIRSGLKVPSIYSRRQPIVDYRFSSFGLNGSIINTAKSKLVVSIAGVLARTDLISEDELLSGEDAIVMSNRSNEEDLSTIITNAKLEKTNKFGHNIQFNMGALLQFDTELERLSNQINNTFRNESRTESNNASLSTNINLSYGIEGKVLSHFVGVDGQAILSPNNNLMIISEGNALPILDFLYDRSEEFYFNEKIKESDIKGILSYESRKNINSGYIAILIKSEYDLYKREYFRPQFSEFTATNIVNSLSGKAIYQRFFSTDWEVTGKIGLSKMINYHFDNKPYVSPIGSISAEGKVGKILMHASFSYDVTPYLAILPSEEYNVIGPVNLQNEFDVGDNTRSSAIAMLRLNYLDARNGVTYSLVGFQNWNDQVVNYRSIDQNLIIGERFLFTGGASTFFQGAIHWRKSNNNGSKIRLRINNSNSQRILEGSFVDTKNLICELEVEKELAMMKFPLTLSTKIIYNNASYAINSLVNLSSVSVRKQISKFLFDAKIGLLSQTVEGITYSLPIIYTNGSYNLKYNWKIIFGYETYAQRITDTRQLLFYTQNQLRISQIDQPTPVLFAGLKYEF